MFNKSGYVRVKQKDLYRKSECFRSIQEILHLTVKCMQLLIISFDKTRTTERIATCETVRVQSERKATGETVRVQSI